MARVIHYQARAFSEDATKKRGLSGLEVAIACDLQRDRRQAQDYVWKSRQFCRRNSNVPLSKSFNRMGVAPVRGLNRANDCNLGRSRCAADGVEKSSIKVQTNGQIIAAAFVEMSACL